MTKPLINLEQVDVVLNGQTVLRKLNWQLRPGQHWAILGGNGSGKTTLLKLIRGDIWPSPGPGRRIYCFNGSEQTSAVGIKEQIGLVSPELQERYLRQAWVLTGQQAILTGCFNTDYLYQQPAPRQKALAASISHLLGIEKLLARNVQQLSTGELRKILIARALVGAPAVLILDEVCDGLDARSRDQLLQVVGRIARTGTQVLYATHRAEEMIPAITHQLVLEKGFIVSCRKRSDAAQVFAGPAATVWRVSKAECADEKSARKVPPAALARALICVTDANVFLGRKKVLRDINWELRADQNWVVFGRNGAGKSTLVKLVFGDLHPAIGGSVRRFDLTPKDSIWALKKQIGYVSPEFQANYAERVTAAEVVASGFFSSVGLRDRVSRQGWKKVDQLFEDFGLKCLGNKLSSQMSYGEFRAVLTMRALVNEPQLLILDEPFDGLDVQAKRAFAEALERVSAKGTRLLIVTHHPGDLPSCITHALVLENGCILCQGAFKPMRSHPATQGFLRMATRAKG